MQEQRDKPSIEHVDAIASEPAGRSTCEARGLAPAAVRIADSASSVAKVLTTLHQKGARGTAWDYAKSILLSISVLAGGAFALEQYLATEYEARKASAEALLSSASGALGATDHVLQANGLRTLSRISEFLTYAAPPGAVSLGRHLRAALFGFPAEYPYFEQSWLIFRDFATSRSTSSSHPLVSSAILREGAAWEHRARDRERVPPKWNGGSLLFQAQMRDAKANNLDLRGIQFGAADLRAADLSGSDCAACGLLGARLDGAQLRGTVLDSSFLAEATMSQADLSFARLNGAVLRKVDAQRATFLQTDLTNADLTEARLDGSTFSQATLFQTNFTGASLRGVRFLQCDVSTATFDDADIEGADFTHAVQFSESLVQAARNSNKAIFPGHSEPKETQK